jgi:hypothetical protein
VYVSRKLDNSLGAQDDDSDIPVSPQFFGDLPEPVEHWQIQ